MKKSVLFLTVTLCVGGLLNSSLLTAETATPTTTETPTPTGATPNTATTQPATTPAPTTVTTPSATTETTPATTSPAPATASTEKPYTVVCEGNKCKVDAQTFKGWRAFHATCHVCHAQDAVGSTFAPSLIERLKDFPKERFIHSVTEGFQGQVGVMPAWKDNPNVMPHLDELWSYLRARSDGVLLPGRPEKLQ
ncbi:hypothetical protein BegalDRAFT_0065 [Beggiatoa alba B18LD]|uniref:Cytochrome c domain-containing protein n=1 Tax=Beggiatoa alba B18LD TaxID=395493 RepID=I3CBJ8_9GAMM|nr:cytochrome c [Beggiatoa alba]EIJ40991.1 hypothetical protein BegalDRAFT_0065 [Beggiatoa alba B18LD]